MACGGTNRCGNECEHGRRDFLLIRLVKERRREARRNLVPEPSLPALEERQTNDLRDGRMTISLSAINMVIL